MAHITFHGILPPSWQTKYAFTIGMNSMQIRHSHDISKLRRLLIKEALTLWVFMNYLAATSLQSTKVFLRYSHSLNGKLSLQACRSSLHHFSDLDTEVCNFSPDPPLKIMQLFTKDLKPEFRFSVKKKKIQSSVLFVKLCAILKSLDCRNL